MLKVATPELFSVPVPSVVLPLMKVTVPVGVAEPDVADATVAVSVTDWPKTLGLGVEVSVVVLARSTSWVRAVEVLVVKFVSPP